MPGRKTDLTLSLKKIDFNPEFEKAWAIISKTSKNLLITGRAGTGKSTFLKFIRDNLKKNLVVLAPTGVSALNIQGQTIHSFFGFKPDITLEKVMKLGPKEDYKDLYKHIQTLIIDEISMVRADLFDCVETFLRKWGPKKGQPFGGVQIILIGDLYQLPPVVTSGEKEIFKYLYETPFFFSARAFKENPFEFVEFEKIYRQRDALFIEILNRIRNGTAEEDVLSILNERVNPQFEPPTNEFYINLTTTNARAEEINLSQLENIKKPLFEFEGSLRGRLEVDDLPAPLILKIKESAQVMLLNNHPEGDWVNGDVGKVIEILPEDETIVVELRRGKIVEVIPFKWEVYEHYFDKNEGIVKTKTIGSFVQFPLKLAWAITIHKSQGLTFERVIIDLEKGTFAHGQLYVALSRCTSLDGIVLKSPVKKGHIRLDRGVIKFLTTFQYALAKKSLPLEEKIKLLKRACQEKKELEIIYLKSSDEKSRRRILPMEVSEEKFRGKPFLALKAFCCLRGEPRTFNVEKILEIKEVDTAIDTGKAN